MIFDPYGGIGLWQQKDIIVHTTISKDRFHHFEPCLTNTPRLGPAADSFELDFDRFGLSAHDKAILAKRFDANHWEDMLNTVKKQIARPLGVSAQEMLLTTKSHPDHDPVNNDILLNWIHILDDEFGEMAVNRIFNLDSEADLLIPEHIKMGSELMQWLAQKEAQISWRRTLKDRFENSLHDIDLDPTLVSTQDIKFKPTHTQNDLDINIAVSTNAKPTWLWAWLCKTTQNDVFIATNLGDGTFETQNVLWKDKDAVVCKEKTFEQYEIVESGDVDLDDDHITLDQAFDTLADWGAAGPVKLL